MNRTRFSNSGPGTTRSFSVAMTLIVATLSLFVASNASAQEVFPIGAGSAVGVAGTVGNTTGGFSLVASPTLSHVTIQGQLTSTDNGVTLTDARFRLVGPGGIGTINMRVTEFTGVSGAIGDFYLSASFPTSPVGNGAWTYEWFDLDNDAGAGPEFSVANVVVTFHTSLPLPYNQQFHRYLPTGFAAPGVGIGSLAAVGSSMATLPLGWMEAIGAPTAGVTAFTAGPRSRNDSQWVQDGIGNTSLDGAIRYNVWSGAGQHHWAMSPILDFGGAPTTYRMTFDAACVAFGTTTDAPFGDPANRFSVIISDAGGATWSANTPGSANEIFKRDTVTNFNPGIAQYVVDFTTSGARRIGVLAARDAATTDDVDVSIDNINIFQLVPFQVDVTNSTGDRIVNTNSDFFYTVNIANTGSTDDTYTVGFAGNVFPVALFQSDMVTPLGPSVFVPNTSSVNIAVRVTVPPGTADLTTDGVTITATGNASDNVLITSTAFEFDFGGPDAGGYRFANNSADAVANSPFGYSNYGFVDVSGTGTPIAGLGDDGQLGPFPIGFPFTFYGTAVTDFHVQGNGFIAFSAPGTGFFANGLIPAAAAPNNACYWYWSDFDYTDTDVPGRGIFYGNAPNGDRVIQYVMAPQWDNSGTNPDEWLSAEVILTQAGGIKFQYLNRGASFDPTFRTVGIENATGTAGTLYHIDGDGGPIVDGGSIDFTTAALVPVEIAGFGVE